MKNDIEYAALYEGNKEIARDDHKGFSGVEKRNIQYSLTLPEVKEGAVYTIKKLSKVPKETIVTEPFMWKSHRTFY